MKFIAMLLSTEAIGIENGKATPLKGKLTARFLSEISSTCDFSKIESGEIWISYTDEVTFSDEIPESKRQQFRNVIFNR